MWYKTQSSSRLSADFSDEYNVESTMHNLQPKLSFIFIFLVFFYLAKLVILVQIHEYSKISIIIF